MFNAFGDMGGVNEDYMARWLTFGPVGLKVVRGHLRDGLEYLNLYVKNIRTTGYHVGGLLGEDSHDDEATPSEKCKLMLDLQALDFQVPQTDYMGLGDEDDDGEAKQPE